MKLVSVVSLITLCIAVSVPAQSKVIATTFTIDDSIQKEKTKLEKEEAQLALKERQLNLLEKDRMLTLRKNAIENRFQCQMSGINNDGNPGCEKFRDRPFHPGLFFGRVLVKLTFLGFLFFITINILLTILVTSDMKKIGRFNALWIPLVLIAGIPISIIYALFRIRDAVTFAQEENQKK